MDADTIGLVADVGRGGVRFGLSGGPGGIAPRQVQEFGTADFSTFTGALTAYLGKAGMRDTALPSTLAVAGAVRGDVVNVTNSRWFVTLSGTRAVLRAPARAINDFVANASALPLVPASALRAVGGQALGPPRAGGTYLAVGPGTGLGVAGLVSINGSLHAVPSEAGHIRFQPATEAEARFTAALAARGIRHPDAECLLSAGGLLAAYRALGGPAGIADAAEVTRRARTDPAARAALDMVLGFFGAFVGDMVLAFGAWDGVYLTGAMARAWHPLLPASTFCQRMAAKGDSDRSLRTVPVAVVDQPRLELLGAAVVLHGA